MNLFFEKTRKVVIARLVLFMLGFAVLGGAVSITFGSDVVFAADSDGDGNEDTTPVPKSFEDQMKDVKENDDTKNGLDAIKGMTNKIKPKANDMTNLVTTPVMGVFNTIIFIALSAINAYFFVQTCFDIAFLLAPAFRDTLSRNQNGENTQGRAARFVNGLISEPALNAVGYNKSSDKGHIDCSEMAAEVDWKSWLTKRLIMFICLMSYLALLLMGLLPKFIGLISQLGYAIVKGIMEIISPGSTK